MNRSGIPTTGKTNKRTAGKDTARTWGVVGLRQLLMRARNAGLIDYHGEIIGKATWDAILSEEKWSAVCAILSDPARRVSPGPKLKHLGTNAYFCGVCLEEDDTEAFMVGQNDFYRCKRKSHFNRKKAPIDEIVVSKIIERLAAPEAVKLLRKTKSATPDNATISADSANIRRQLRELDESYKGGRISMARYELVSVSLEERLTRNEKATRISMEEDPLEGIAGKPDAAAIWAGLPAERKRAILRSMCEVIIYRQKYQQNQYIPFDPDSVWIDWLR
jgi:hypothetical protein